MDLAKLEERAKAEIDKHLNNPTQEYPRTLGWIPKPGWTFKYTHGRRQLGVCYYDLKLIKISRDYAKINEEERMVNTLLHEIAHALAGPYAGHGPLWKKVARMIGSNGQRLASPGRDGLPLVTPPRKIRGAVDYSLYKRMAEWDLSKKITVKENEPKTCNPVPVMV